MNYHKTFISLYATDCWKLKSGCTYIMVNYPRCALIQAQLVELVESARQHFACLGEQEGPIAATVNGHNGQSLWNIHLCGRNTS